MHFVDMIDMSAQDQKARLLEVSGFLHDYYEKQQQSACFGTQKEFTKKSLMRAKQLEHSYFELHDITPDTITTIPKNERQPIIDMLFPNIITPVQIQQDDDGKTVKTL
ncbi:MAG: hypothetical protein LBI63_03150, partial [Candidatus Ancillula sp.]|nr:hypothetical protein [Candidatus Ancillula sp.]